MIKSTQLVFARPNGSQGEENLPSIKKCSLIKIINPDGFYESYLTDLFLFKNFSRMIS
jgi:hypothetical protein